MSEAPETLIDDLVGNLAPITPLRAKSLWTGVGVAIILAAIYIFVVYGPRPEIRAWLHGVWMGEQMMWLKPLLFLGIGAGALWSVTDLARPQGQFRARTLLPLIAAMVIVLGMLVRDLVKLGVDEVLSHAHDPATLCFLTILCGGMAGFVIMWRFWLRRSATSHPVLLGIMSGLAAASFMAAAYAVHCNMDTPVYILLIYGAPVALMAALAGMIGGRIFRW